MGTSCCEGHGNNYENQNIVVFDSNEFRINNSNLRNSNVLLRESVSRQERIKNYRESLFDKDGHNENEITNDMKANNNNSIGVNEDTTNKEMCRPFEKDEQIKIDSDRTDIDVNGIKHLNKNEEASNNTNHTNNTNNEVTKVKATKKTKVCKKKNKSNIENIDTNNKCKDIFEKYKYIFEKPQIVPEKRLRSKSKLNNNNTTNQSIISNQTNNPNQQFQTYDIE